ncbi:MAG: HlyD family efflux transporter periplasmic adaptor subunit [Betaproteobacteria bacterium]|nr:HlyD family efflux transporter periplasmic adaptor subunit [Betaproteobacteria bacterium]
MMRRLAAPVLSALLLTALLAAGGCSDPAPPERAGARPASAPSGDTPRYVAVARGRIDVEGGLLKLSAQTAGVVAGVDVHDGDTVERGQVLATLQSDDARDAVEVALGRLEQAQAQVALVDTQANQARQLATTLASAAAAGAETGQNATDAASRVRQLQAREAAARAAVTVARGELDAARHALARHTLRAPVAGQITDVAVQPGESVSPEGAPMFTLLPDSPRIIVAELDGDFAAAVNRGMRADVVLDGDTETVIGGARVTVVGQVFGPSGLEDDPAQRTSTRTVKCRLRFDEPTRLRIGQRVLVRFLPAHAAGR